ncbi:DUF1223 domain-containing protein [Aquimarina sp. M1]
MIRNLLIVLTITIYSNTTAQHDSKSIVVMELFTSQGCSSCPPADELLDVIKDTYEYNNVFVLSYHVDYWNRLGWKDPFSTEVFSDYQRDYAEQFKSRSIYTPQLVVNGSEHFTGSNRSKALEAIDRYSKSTPGNSIKLMNLKNDDQQIVLEYDIEGSTFDQVTFALVVSKRITEINRGENRNKTLSNSNIVANRLVMKDASGWVTILVPNWIDEKDKLSIIAYTQNNELEITGASSTNI